MKKILLINGPNLNNLGNRDKSLYGEITLKKVIKELERIHYQVIEDLRIFMKVIELLQEF